METAPVSIIALRNAKASKIAEEAAIEQKKIKDLIDELITSTDDYNRAMTLKLPSSHTFPLIIKNNQLKNALYRLISLDEYSLIIELYKL